MPKERDYSYLRGDTNDKFKRIDPDIREKFMALPDELKAKSLAAKTFILYPFEIKEQQSKTFEQKDRDTIEFIENHLKEFKTPYVATSFGKDSMVLMHLVMRACKNLNIDYPDMFLNDTLNTFKEEKQYWADMTKEWGIIDKVKLWKPPVDERGNMMTVWSIAKKVGHLPSFRSTKNRNKQGVNKTKKQMGGSGGGTPECCDILKKKTMKKYLNSMPENERYDLQFVGTRAEESRMRAMSLLQRCRTYVIKTFVKYPMRTCTPLSFWTMEDTTEYYKKYNIPMNPAYKAHDIDRMGCASCPAHMYWASRLAEDPTEEGFGMLKQNFRILKQTEADGTEAKGRLQDCVDELKLLLKTNVSHYMKKHKVTLSQKMRERLEVLIDEFEGPKDL